MKNKALFLLLTAALLLTGCTAKSAEPSSSPAPTATAEPTDTPAPTAEPTPTPEPTPAPPDLSELPGTVEKRVYSNRYFSIGCELEPNWTYYSPAQIEELTDMARRGMDESGAAAFDEALSPDGAAYCMAAAANKLNLNMAVQKAAGSDPYTILTDAAGELTEALKGFGLAGRYRHSGIRRRGAPVSEGDRYRERAYDMHPLHGAGGLGLHRGDHCLRSFGGRGRGDTGVLVSAGRKIIYKEK